MSRKEVLPLLNRRRTLAMLSGAGAAVLIGQGGGSDSLLALGADAINCVAASPQATEGPYWVDEKLNRSDIRTDPSNGSISAGVPLTLTIAVQELSSTGCSVLPGAQVDIWHCDAAGVYSDEAANNSVGRKFLRGYQITGDDGVVQFTTIYPGWYSGRTVHIHVRIRTLSGSQVYDTFTSQFFFDDAVTDQVFTLPPYNQRRQRDTRNANDMVLTGTGNGSRLMLALTKTGEAYAASIVLGVNLKTAPAGKPAIAASGVVSAASYQAGIAPGSWVSIFGQNFSAATRTLAASDIVNGNLPTALGGVSVQIDNKPAFIAHVSPGQINVQAPASANTGAVQVVATNSNGASDPIPANLLGVLPAFFTFQNYVAAVRADGVVIAGAVAAKPGDALQLYGTGFGPTLPDVAPGKVFNGNAPLAAPATVMVGGMPAPVSFSGLAGAGLNQINVTVPPLPDGDHPVIAESAGVSTQAGVLLKIKN
jgi:Protocatechuate 3,4-dioxygenase beta subunit